ncbi:hypothetical protein [Streptomyces sp. TLI_105]|uniref:hypothetical protein n=1 Tax=Streptomyces sp. TLI_105 TaxID=1881019 RepID=UPI00089983F7|nr:hypothetical protein [Streptomyces sp. TLI_105]SEC81876.1 hypothetical protein SAMN05428939_3362 [Streptomyces sp. TLI_105]
MATFVSDLEQAIVQHFDLPWPEVDEETYPPLVTALNAYAQFTLDDGWAAHRHMQRLMSSGQGEALDALWEHWVRVMARDMGPVATSAHSLALTVNEIPSAIVTLKQTIAYEAGALAGRNAIGQVGGVLTFGASAVDAAVDADKTRRRVAQQVLSTASAIRRSLKALLADASVVALDKVPSDLSGGVGGGIAAGAGVAGATGGVAGGVAGGAAGDARHAGGSGGTGGDLTGSTGIRVDHDEHKLAASRIASVSDDVLGRTGAELATATAQHATARGSGSFAEALAPDIDLVLDRLAAATAAVGDHLAGALPDAILLISEDQQSTDDDNRHRMSQVD